MGEMISSLTAARRTTPSSAAAPRAAAWAGTTPCAAERQIPRGCRTSSALLFGRRQGPAAWEGLRRDGGQVEGEGRPVPRVRRQRQLVLGGHVLHQNRADRRRTCDNPLLPPAIKAGATHILLEKPGAPTAGEPGGRRPARPRRPRSSSTWASSRLRLRRGALAAANGAAGAEAVETKLGVVRDHTEATLRRVLRAHAEGTFKNMAIHEIAPRAGPGACAPTHITYVICNAKGGKDSPGCDMRTLGGKTDSPPSTPRLATARVRRCASRLPVLGRRLLRDGHGHVERRRFISTGDGRRRGSEGRRGHRHFYGSRLYTQAEEYAKLGRLRGPRPRGHDAAGRGDHRDACGR